MALILSGDTGVPASGMPTGSVIQVVNASYGTNVAVTNSNYATTGLSATITPKATTSKILILINTQQQVSTAYGFGLAIYRNGSSVYADTNLYDSGYLGTLSASYRPSRSTLQYLDSPASISALTYTLYAASYTGTINFNNDGAKSMITLMEIQA
jgi:hypothetical protein